MAEIFHALSVILIVSSFFLLLLDRLSHPSIPAYILAGIGIGVIADFGILPGMLSWITLDQSQITSFAQLGIIFLVFIFGLNMEPERLSSVAEDSLLTAIIVTTIMGFGAYTVGIALGLNIINALYFSIAAAISSSLVGLELIDQELRMDLLHGRLAESIHLLQDTMAILFILFSGALTSPNFVTGVGTGILLLIAALGIRSLLLKRIAEMAEQSQELTMLISLGFLTGFIAVTEITGLSNVIGSFAAGLAMAKFPYNTESLETVKPLKDFFSAIFFVSLGALLTWPTPTAVMFAAALLFGTMVVKPLLASFHLMHIGYDHRTSYLAGFSLDQVSEFGLIIAIQALLAGYMIEPLFNGIVIAAVTTMIVSSYTNRYDERLYSILNRYLDIEENSRKIEDRTDVGDIENHAIVVGYGTQGQRIIKALEEQEKEIVVVENDPEKVTEAKKHLEHYVFGDAVDDKTWEAAKAGKADLIISTVPSHQLSEEILSIDTTAEKLLRTETVEEAQELLNQGALFVEVPDIVASEQLVEHIHRVKQDINYREELRRKNLLELRKYLTDKK